MRTKVGYNTVIGNLSLPDIVGSYFECGRRTKVGAELAQMETDENKALKGPFSDVKWEDTVEVYRATDQMLAEAIKNVE